ncbi:MAG TPA: haloacid dehalogenase-like hydrolase [Gammaproteobacteria bacterium]|nr:haloacid dehalogenase-like hydrolase [Gammaproteobacteria bacterium]|tara:strand:+ start:1434 stop:2315 length:882 start_codon:yes stop_codon:yes gene_type:complete
MLKTAKTRFTRNILAMVYDFDGTLTPQPMQEYTVLPELGISGEAFWNEVNDEVIRTGGDRILTYMRLLVEKIDHNKKHLSREALRKLAANIEYYPGVNSWFDRVNQYVETKSKGTIAVRHYIISAGLSEILEGVSIKSKFERIYASEYFFNHHETACFPTIVINDTTKTQYLFRINKGREGAGDSINEYMPEGERPIPFTNMLYIGDGLTDVPCMTVVKNYGGYAVAVHNPNNQASVSVCQDLADANRIDYFAPANYCKGRKLEKRVHTILDIIIAKILFENEKFKFQQEYLN